MTQHECLNCGHVFTPGVDPEWAESMRRRRVAKEVYLYQVAEHLGLSSVYISDIERGKRNKPDAAIVAKWEAYLESGGAA